MAITTDVLCFNNIKVATPAENGISIGRYKTWSENSGRSECIMKSESGCYFVDAGKDKTQIITIPKGTKVHCYGYYNQSDSTKWLLVVYNRYMDIVLVPILKC